MDLRPNKRCAACGAAFTCEYEAGQESCWCGRELPPVPGIARAGGGCLCRACLTREMERVARGAVPGAPPKP